jgi:hypothetical protein
VAQVFTANSNYTITKVKLLLLRHATNNPGTITVEIIPTTGGAPVDDNPSAEIASGTTDGSTLPTGSPYEWREIIFSSPVALTSGIKYAVVCKATGAPTTTSAYWRYDVTGVYTGGDLYASTTSGNSWSVGTNQDCLFETYDAEASAYDEDTPIVSGTGSVVLTIQTYTPSGIDYDESVLIVSALLSVSLVVENCLKAPIQWPPTRPAGIADDDTLHNNTLIAVGYDADGLGIIYFKET